MDKVQKPVITQCYTPSSKPFRIYVDVKFGGFDEVRNIN
jgi:hypothetical protein